MPFAGIALGLFGLVTITNFTLDREMAVNKARREAARLESERVLQAERDKSQVRLRIAEEETQRKVDLITSEQ